MMKIDTGRPLIFKRYRTEILTFYLINFQKLKETNSFSNSRYGFVDHVYFNYGILMFMVSVHTL